MQIAQGSSETTGVFFVVVMMCFLWGFIGKAMAASRGLHERSGFWLGFILWFIGLFVIAATPAKREKSEAKMTEVRSSAKVQSTIDERLRSLVSLRDQGLVSEGEFEQRRKAILDEL